MCSTDGKERVTYTDKEFEKFMKGGPKEGYTFKNGNVYFNGDLTATYSNSCLSCGTLISALNRTNAPIGKATFQAGLVTAFLGATGGAGAYVLGTGATITTLGTLSRAAPAAGAGGTVLSQLSQKDAAIFQRAAELGASGQNAFMNNVGILRDALFQVAGPDKQIT